MESRTVLDLLLQAGHPHRSASSQISPDLVQVVRAQTPRPAQTRSHSTAASAAPPRPLLPRDVEAQAKALFGEDVRLRPRRQEGRAPAGPRRKAPVSERQRIDAAWATRLFTREERQAWMADGLTERDADLAEAYRRTGLLPGDLSRVVSGRTGRQWLQAGITVRDLAERLGRFPVAPDLAPTRESRLDPQGKGEHL